MVTMRGQSKPPADLAVLIDAANSVEKLPQYSEELFSGDGVAVRNKLEALGPEARAFLGEPDNAEEFRNSYDALQSAQEILPRLATQARDESGFISTPFSVPVNLYIDAAGIIGASGTFINALQGVPLDRIAKCAVCPKIFWKPRVNSECCDEKCRKRYNKRNSRAAQKNLPWNKRNKRSTK